MNDVDDQLVNSAPIQEQLAKLNATYKDILDRLEQERIKLDIVSAHLLSPAFLPCIEVSCNCNLMILHCWLILCVRTRWIRDCRCISLR